MTPRILIVEDNPDDLDMVLLTLNMGGCEPYFRCVEDLAGLADALRTEVWDVALCDYTLPDFSGMGALRAICETKGGDLPVIFVSGMVGEETAVSLMRAGARDYVYKSNLTRLVPAIEREIAAAASLRDKRRTEEMLREAQKMEVVGQLASGIAHDFSNMLTPVLGSLDILRKKFSSDRETAHLVEVAISAAVSGAELARSLLSFGRTQPLMTEMIALDEVTGTQVDMLRRLLGKAIAIRLICRGEVWPVMADRNQLQNALMNLALNARDAMPDGGTLTFKLRNSAANDIQPTDSPRDRDYAVLEISDTGTGIAAKDLPRVFEPFYTTKERGKGSGLGLSMVRGFVQQAGGHIEIDSTEGLGTTFRLYLPRMVDGFAHASLQPSLEALQEQLALSA